MGIFVKQFIPKNTLLWKYKLNCNIKYYDNKDNVIDYMGLFKTYKEKYDFISHVYVCDGVFNEILDDGKYWNHSEEPNTYSGVDGDIESSYANRDIQKGEVSFFTVIYIYVCIYRER